MTVETERQELRIEVPVLARVEGEGALDVAVRNGRITDLRLRIYEPPRLFEQFLRGHHYTELPELVARICGICPAAYQMSAVRAVERLFCWEPDPWVQAMRRLFYCAEWIQSHALHIHLLAAPDFLGFDSAIAMAARYRAEVRRGLELQALGNALIRLLGARSVHPVGARPGGFWHLPDAAEVAALRERVVRALPAAEALVAWTTTLDLPDGDQEFTCVALAHPTEYPMIGERIVSDDGLDISIDAFEQHFREDQVPHSTALHAWLHERPYLVGPLARLNLHAEKLHPQARAALERTTLRLPSRNPFHSIVARALELYQALLEAAALLADYQPTAHPYAELQPRAGTAIGASEAPRGLLWHRYRLDAAGLVEEARIVPPTSQNQPRIEDDLRLSLTAAGLDREPEALRRLAETVIRNYDPCISCATHFLRLRLSR